MRPLILGGIVLLLAGSYAAFRGVNYRSNRNVLKIGELEAKVEEQRTVPPWVGGVLILGGIVMIVAGARQSKV